MTKELKSIKLLEDKVELLKIELTDLTNRSDEARLEFDSIRAKHRKVREEIIEMQNEIAYVRRLHEIAERSEEVPRNGYKEDKGN